MTLFSFVQNQSSKVYMAIVGLLYAFYIMAFLGIYYVNPEYTKTLSLIVRLFVSVVLMYRFNPLYKVTLSESDRTLIFAAGFFLFVNTGMTEILFRYMEKPLSNMMK